MGEYSFLSANRLVPNNGAAAAADKVKDFSKGGFNTDELKTIVKEFEALKLGASEGGLNLNGFSNYKDTLQAKFSDLLKYLESAPKEPSAEAFAAFVPKK